MSKAEERALEAYPNLEPPTFDETYPRILFTRYTERNAYIQGYKKAEKDMMEQAVETVVSLEAGGFPFIEYGVGDLGLKVGDKVKVIIIKEN